MMSEGNAEKYPMVSVKTMGYFSALISPKQVCQRCRPGSSFIVTEKDKIEQETGANKKDG